MPPLPWFWIILGAGAVGVSLIARGGKARRAIRKEMKAGKKESRADELRAAADLLRKRKANKDTKRAERAAGLVRI